MKGNKKKNVNKQKPSNIIDIDKGLGTQRSGGTELGTGGPGPTDGGSTGPSGGTTSGTSSTPGQGLGRKYKRKRDKK